MAIRRGRGLYFSSFLVLLLLIASAPSAVLAQGGGFKPAGNYQNTSMLASVFYNDPETSVFVFADRQITVGSSSTTDESTLALSISASFGSMVLNCSINDTSGDFTVASDVSSARLLKTIPAGAPACGGSTTADVTVDISWTGAGPVQSTTTSRRFACGGYTDESHGTDSNNAGPATVSLIGLDSPITITTPDAQTFHFGNSIEHAQGAVPADSCNGGVGRGAGRATPAAGNYASSLQEASTFSFSGGSFLMLTVDRSTNKSNPLGGTSASTSQTALTLSGPADVGGCFLINSGDFNFARDLSSASLSTTLTSATPACNPGAGNVVPPDGFTISAVWSGTAPVATTRTDSQFACSRYHFQTNSTQVVNSVADLTVTMAGTTTTLAGSSSLGSLNILTHADGTPASGCLFRG